MVNHKLHITKLWLLYLGVFISSITAYSQKLTITTSGTTVPLNEYFELNVQLEGAEGDIKFQLPAELQIVQGPSRSSSYSFINGKSSQSLSIGYLVAATKIGKFTIKPASVSVNGKNIVSNSVNISVVAGSNTQAGNRQGGNQGNNREVKADDNSKNEYFIHVSTDKSSAYQGEPITVTYTFYLRNSGLENLQVKKMPSFPGFWVKDLPSAVDNDFHEEVYQGKKFLVAVLKKAIIYPQKSGNMNIDQLTADAVLTKRAKMTRNQNDPFAGFFDDFFEGTESFRKTLVSDNLTLKIKALPEQGKPELFSGLVGSFSGKCNLNKNKLKENEALTLLYTINGIGNIQVLEPPVLNLPDNWDVYDPKIIDKQGGKVFEYTIVPKKEGKFEMEAPSIAYFDINSKSYKSIAGNNFSVEVSKGDGSAGGTALSQNSISKQDVKLLNQDIAFNSSDTELIKESSPYFNSPAFYSLTGFSLLSIFLIGFFAKQKERDNEDTFANRQRKSGEVAKKSLKKAEKLKQEGKSDEFYVELINATYSFFKNNTGLENSELTNDSIKLELHHKLASPELIKSTIKLLDDALFARYAPSLGAKNMDAAFQQANEVITQLSNLYKV